VLLCDLNSFKKVNDKFGHLTGNKLLQEVSASLRLPAAEYDQSAGSAETNSSFLPDMTKDLVSDIEERLARAVREPAATFAVSPWCPSGR